jgi:hypothetical protein
MNFENADRVAGSAFTGCRGGLVDVLVESTSRAFILFEIPLPTVDFVVNGTGSIFVGKGGQLGNAVERLLPPADLGFSIDSLLCDRG